MVYLNLGQDVANAHIVVICYPLKQAAGMRRYGSLFNINPSGLGSSSKCCAFSL